MPRRPYKPAVGQTKPSLRARSRRAARRGIPVGERALKEAERGAKATTPASMANCALAIHDLCSSEPLKSNGTIGSMTHRWLAQYHLCPPNGGTHCLERHRELVGRCLASRTSCASRCNVVAPAPSADADARFFADLASEVIGKVSEHRAGGSCFVNRLPRGRVPAAAASLIDGLVRPSCAVVGNSPVLLTRNDGASIDGHDVVIRFNFAPTTGFEHNVGTKTSIRFMGKSWVWSEAPVNSSLPDPILMHRYNYKKYFEEDIRLNGGYNIATLDHAFQLHGFGLARRVKRALSRRSKYTAAELGGLKKYERQKKMLAPITSGFSGLLFAMYACSEVSLYGFDLAGLFPGHYFNDTREGIMAHLAELTRREPHRKASFSVDPGLYGTTKVDIINEQYTDDDPEHPIHLERGIIRAWKDSSCLRTSEPAAGMPAASSKEGPLVLLRPGLRGVKQIVPPQKLQDGRCRGFPVACD